ncbi:ThiF family adenylyltransferase [Lactiplantibacillus pentosus]
MKKIQLNTSIAWRLEGKDIVVYATNRATRFAITVEKPSTVYKFLVFLQSPRSYPDVNAYSGLTAKEKNSILNYLSLNHFLNDVTNWENHPDRLTKFVASMPNSPVASYYKKVQETQICLIGLGTTGSYIFDSLIKLGISNIVLIDNDLVEKRNLIAQNFYETDVGSYKTTALKKRYGTIAKDVKTFNQRVTSTNDLKPVLCQNVWLINCCDDPELRADMYKKFYSIFPHGHFFETGYIMTDAFCIEYDKPKMQDMYLYAQRTNAENIESERNGTPMLYENTGSVLDSLSVALMVAKTIFNKLTSDPDTLFNNHFSLSEDTYFIGSDRENQIYQSFVKWKRSTIPFYQKHPLTK